MTEIPEWQPYIEHLKDMRDFYADEIKQIDNQVWKGCLASRAICNFIFAHGHCPATIGGEDRPDTLKCQLRIGHEGKHRGANAVTWNFRT